MIERKYKGKSIVEKLQDYVVIDIETTGLSSTNSEIIEFAAVKVKNGKIVGKYQTLIKPHYPVSSFITSLTGISNSMLKDAPRMDEVIMDIYDYLQGEIIVGHNVNFDYNFLYDVCLDYLAIPLSNDYLDTLRLVRKIFKHFPNHQLDTCAKYLNEKCFPSHRAMNDVLATQELLNKIYQYLDENNLDLNEIFRKNNSNRI